MNKIISLFVTLIVLVTTRTSAFVDDPVGLMATLSVYQTHCEAKGFGPPIPQATWSYLKTVLTAHGIGEENLDVKLATQVALRVLQDPELQNLMTESNNEALMQKCQALAAAMPQD